VDHGATAGDGRRQHLHVIERGANLCYGSAWLQRGPSAGPGPTRTRTSLDWSVQRGPRSTPPAAASWSVYRCHARLALGIDTARGPHGHHEARSGGRPRRERGIRLASYSHPTYGRVLFETEDLVTGWRSGTPSLIAHNLTVYTRAGLPTWDVTAALRSPKVTTSAY